MAKKAGKITRVFVQNIISDEEVLDHDYNISGAKKKRILNRSENESWSAAFRCGYVAHCKDDGNGIKIKFDDGTKIKLDYGQASQLMILLLDNCDYRIDLEEGITVKMIK